MVRTKPEMGSTPSRGFRLRAVPFLLAVPLIAVPTVAYLVVFAGSQAGGLPVAQGSTGGTFHPIAGEFEPDETELEGCSADSACLEQAFGNVSYRQGPRRALALFEQRMAADPAVERGCHRIAHTIGSAALKRFDGNIARTFSQGSPTCVSGYYHGILERSFLGITTKARLVEVARSLCAGGELRRRGFLDYQCRHGLGHGLMIQTGYDLPLTLSVCARLGTGWDRKACASGSFMENIDTRFGYRSPWLDDEDPLYPCERLGMLDQHSCYLRASWRILTLSGGDFRSTAAGCAELGTWARTCFRGYGRDAAEDARYAPVKIRRLCKIAREGREDCLLGAARTIANASGARGIQPAAALCEGAARAARAACFSGVGLVIGMLHPTDASRSAACARITRAYQRACAMAAIAEVDSSGRDSWG
jgi:hypothetical protein